VLIPDATFWATFEAVVNCGAQPVTIDIDESDLQMDFDLFRRGFENYRPSAAILVHLYGWGSARLDEFRGFCREHGLPLLEDAAQAFGVQWQGRSIFQDALISTLSFYPAKVLGACGDAGAILTGDAAMAERLRQLANHGRTGHYDHGLLGWNSRLGGFEASFLRLSLEYLPERLRSRRHAATRYRRALGELGVRTVAPPEGYEENGYLCVSLHDPDVRHSVEIHLRKREIGFGKVYPGSMSRQPAAPIYLAGQEGGERAAKLSASVLNLPLFAHITEDEVDEVIGAVAEALDSCSSPTDPTV
jgi:dTDP-4-amino-4,6-dideoxygalactose transaminase